MLPSKDALKQELLDLVDADLRALERIQKATQEGATHAESKAENSKDTRAVEQSYLARGQAGRVEELRTGWALVHAMPILPVSSAGTVGLGALVTLEEGDATRILFVAPYGGGYKLAAGSIQVVTPRSPLGAGVMGKAADDLCDVVLAGRSREMTIINVA